MYEYLLSGTNSRGWRKTVIAEAATADEAVRKFESQGYSDIVLHTDDLVAPFYKPSSLVKTFRPAEIVYMRRTGPIAFSWILTKAFYRQLWITILLAACIIALRRVSGTPWDAWDSLPLLLAFMPLGVGVYVGLSASRRPERRLLKAIGWARWEEALHILTRSKLKISPFERHLRQSQALAGLGRVSEAMMEFDKVRDIPEVTEHRYWAFQAMVYAAAKEPEKVLSVIVRAHEFEPNGTAVRIDYANRLLILRRDVRGAREILAKLGHSAIADFAMPAKLATEGLLNLAEGRTADAVELLKEAVRRVEPFTRGNPSLLPVCARVRAWLCQALTANGDIPAARRQLKYAGPVLAANQEHDLLRQCEQAIG